MDTQRPVTEMPPETGLEGEPLGIRAPFFPLRSLGQSAPSLQFMKPLGTNSLTVLDSDFYLSSTANGYSALERSFTDSPFFEPPSPLSSFSTEDYASSPLTIQPALDPQLASRSAASSSLSVEPVRSPAETTAPSTVSTAKTEAAIASPATKQSPSVRSKDVPLKDIVQAKSTSAVETSAESFTRQKQASIHPSEENSVEGRAVEGSIAEEREISQLASSSSAEVPTASTAALATSKAEQREPKINDLATLPAERSSNAELISTKRESTAVKSATINRKVAADSVSTINTKNQADSLQTDTFQADISRTSTPQLNGGIDNTSTNSGQINVVGVEESPVTSPVAEESPVGLSRRLDDADPIAQTRGESAREGGVVQSSEQYFEQLSSLEQTQTEILDSAATSDSPVISDNSIIRASATDDTPLTAQDTEVGVGSSAPIYDEAIDTSSSSISSISSMPLSVQPQGNLQRSTGDIERPSSAEETIGVDATEASIASAESSFAIDTAQSSEQLLSAEQTQSEALDSATISNSPIISDSSVVSNNPILQASATDLIPLTAQDTEVETANSVSIYDGAVDISDSNISSSSSVPSSIQTEGLQRSTGDIEQPSSVEGTIEINATEASIASADSSSAIDTARSSEQSLPFEQTQPEVIDISAISNSPVISDSSIVSDSPILQASATDSIPPTNQNTEVETVSPTPIHSDPIHDEAVDISNSDIFSSSSMPLSVQLREDLQQSTEDIGQPSSVKETTEVETTEPSIAYADSSSTIDPAQSSEQLPSLEQTQSEDSDSADVLDSFVVLDSSVVSDNSIIQASATDVPPLTAQDTEVGAASLASIHDEAVDTSDSSIPSISPIPSSVQPQRELKQLIEDVEQPSSVEETIGVNATELSIASADSSFAIDVAQSSEQLLPSEQAQPEALDSSVVSDNPVIQASATDSIPSIAQDTEAGTASSASIRDEAVDTLDSSSIPSISPIPSSAQKGKDLQQFTGEVEQPSFVEETTDGDSFLVDSLEMEQSVDTDSLAAIASPNIASPDISRQSEPLQLPAPGQLMPPEAIQLTNSPASAESASVIGSLSRSDTLAQPWIKAESADTINRVAVPSDTSTDVPTSSLAATAGTESESSFTDLKTGEASLPTKPLLPIRSTESVPTESLSTASVPPKISDIEASSPDSLIESFAGTADQSPTVQAKADISFDSKPLVAQTKADAPTFANALPSTVVRSLVNDAEPVGSEDSPVQPFVQPFKSDDISAHSQSAIRLPTVLQSLTTVEPLASVNSLLQPASEAAPTSNAEQSEVETPSALSPTAKTIAEKSTPKLTPESIIKPPSESIPERAPDLQRPQADASTLRTIQHQPVPKTSALTDIQTDTPDSWDNIADLLALTSSGTPTADTAKSVPANVSADAPAIQPSATQTPSHASKAPTIPPVSSTHSADSVSTIQAQSVASNSSSGPSAEQRSSSSTYPDLHPFEPKPATIQAKRDRDSPMSDSIFAEAVLQKREQIAPPPTTNLTEQTNGSSPEQFSEQFSEEQTADSNTLSSAKLEQLAQVIYQQLKARLLLERERSGSSRSGRLL
ncbi:hypothetical protein [cf. Phormidesmis sp. LEGE 11477]|uniref:hypothetical protein n=1 Tax=cf. Phormidesmis sp. LEGE 11477 TaxID=1828680 RepID=UPI001882DA9E|nr:hypothetical protein [cf. Phormidesmis sp. LEGE 11477]MBE9062423.1 hypothetical protein [cf. Phormidesmis sp. LEGE 11477]